MHIYIHIPCVNMIAFAFWPVLLTWTPCRTARLAVLLQQFPRPRLLGASLVETGILSRWRQIRDGGGLGQRCQWAVHPMITWGLFRAYHITIDVENLVFIVFRFFQYIVHQWRTPNPLVLPLNDIVSGCTLMWGRNFVTSIDQQLPRFFVMERQLSFANHPVFDSHRLRRFSTWCGNHTIRIPNWY